MERVFCVLCLISILASRSIGQLTIYNGSNDETLNQFGLFDTPYANLPVFGFIDFRTEGTLYYSKMQCNSTFPQPSIVELYSYLLVDDYDLCILQRIALAKQAGYDCLLTYTVDDSVSKISDAIFNTGFPVAIIKYDVAQKMKDSLLNDTSTGSLTVSGSITLGIVIISSSFCGLCCITHYVFCFYCIYTSGPSVSLLYRDKWQRRRNKNEDVSPLPADTINREEITLTQLPQQDGTGGGQTPLRHGQTRALPETTFQKKAPREKRNRTCFICVNEFVNGVSSKTLPCNHIVHSECIDERLDAGYSVVLLCPLCKLDLRPRLHTSQRSHSINSYSSDDRLLSSQGSNYGSANYS